MTSRRQRTRRTWYDVWASILDSLVSEDASLSGIVISAKLNWKTAKKHLSKLEAAKLIRPNQSRFVKYCITKDGISWLNRYKGLPMNKAKEADYDRLDF